MYKLGADILEVSRIEKALERSERFKEKIFTERERKYIEKKSGIRSAGGMFCSKEAVSKLLGTGIRGFGWKDIEVVHDELGKPGIILHGSAFAIACEQGLKDIELTISHSDRVIIAVAIGEAEEKRDKAKPYKFAIPKRRADSHKGDYGKVGVVGGSTGMVGAPYMSSKAAHRSGAGLVYSFVPSGIAEIMQIKSLENIVVPADDGGQGFFSETSYRDISERLESMDVLAIGPGMGRDESTGAFLAEAIKNTDVPIVVDADGIRHLKRMKDELKKMERDIVITPHIAEFSDFIDVETEKVVLQREKYAVDTAAEYGITVVLKGNRTVVTDGSYIYVNDTGNPGMATAGSGDVLTGIIASFIGQGFGTLESAKLGVYVHGASGDRAADKIGEYGMISSDIIENIPYVIRDMVEN